MGTPPRYFYRVLHTSQSQQTTLCKPYSQGNTDLHALPEEIHLLRRRADRKLWNVPTHSHSTPTLYHLPDFFTPLHKVIGASGHALFLTQGSSVRWHHLSSEDDTIVQHSLLSCHLPGFPGSYMTDFTSSRAASAQTSFRRSTKALATEYELQQKSCPVFSLAYRIELWGLYQMKSH